MSFDGELFSSIPRQVPPMQGVPADNRVARHYTGTAAADQAKIGKYRINGLRNRLVGASAAIDNILKGLNEMDAVMAGAPSEELAAAQQALIDLQKRNDGLIRECRRWKGRAGEAEAKLAELKTTKPEELVAREAVLDGAAEPVPAVAFLRRPPGDAIRYLAGEVMKHAEDNPFLAGAAMALGMVADDVDRLPQGTR